MLSMQQNLGPDLVLTKQGDTRLVTIYLQRVPIYNECYKLAALGDAGITKPKQILEFTRDLCAPRAATP